MPRTAILTAILALAMLAVAPLSALAKEGIVAHLDAPLPTDAAPGEHVTIGWSLAVPGGGRLIGTAVVLRIYPGDGGPVVDVPAIEASTGHWSASATVPPGGIRSVGIGIPGVGCTGSVCSPAMDFFSVTDPRGSPLPLSPTPPATNTASTGTPDIPRALALVFAGAFLVSLLLGPQARIAQLPRRRGRR